MTDTKALYWNVNKKGPFLLTKNTTTYKQDMNWTGNIYWWKKSATIERIQHCIGKNILFQSSFNQLFLRIGILLDSDQWPRNYFENLLILKKNFMALFYGWGSTASRLQSQNRETVYFLPQSSQEVLVLIWLTSERWKAELTLEPPSGFEGMTLDWESGVCILVMEQSHK